MINQSDSRVEVKGLEARFYDSLMNILTFGTYPSFIRNVIRSMDIKKYDKVLELGSGTGRNICLMKEYTDNQITGFDIGDIMLSKSQKRCRKFKNITIQKQSIIDPIPYEQEFDKIFISFVFHGFTQENRLKILKNVQKALKPEGRFYILDYNEMDVEKQSGFIKFFFRKVECPLAEDFVKYDWKKILTDYNMDDFQSKLFYKNAVRLLSCRKK